MRRFSEILAMHSTHYKVLRVAGLLEALPEVWISCFYLGVLETR